MVEVGYILILAVAILTGVTSLFTKKSLISLHAAQYNAGRSVIDFVILLILAPFLMKWPGWTAIGLTAGISLLALIGGTLTTKSIRHKNMTEIFPLFNLSPAILVVLAFIFLGERIATIQYVGIAAIMIGAYFLQADKKDFLKPFKSLKNKYVIFVIITLFIYSVTATIEKYSLGPVSEGFIIEPIVYLWWIRLFLSIYYFLYDAIVYDMRELKVVLSKNWKQLGSIAGVGWVSLGLLYSAFPLLPVSILIPIKRSSTLFSTILGGKFFKEGHYAQRIIACAVMLTGVILMIV